MSNDRTTRLVAFSRRFIQLSRAWRQEADAALAPLGLSYATAQALLVVHSFESAPRQVALACELDIEGPSLVRLLDQLCNAGLLYREDDPNDGRAKIIRLTARGAALVARIETALDALRRRLMTCVSDGDLAAALRVLDSIAAVIEHREVAA
ncbi:MAG: MarR family winged helix-turn-helix transcriptional regulator [Phyllobacterium sp.]|uniref:MarR family winged helix-turn-helix transcriptional regulator n=1 Tax=Phyllobacterium sp. TaxID=1871046 RepID=UPI0030F32ED1